MAEADTPNIALDQMLADVVGQTEGMPPMPVLDDKVGAYTKALWDETANHPLHKKQVQRWKNAQKSLVPQRWGSKDQIPSHLKTGSDHRDVGSPILYRNIATTVAMTVPDSHRFDFRPRKQVQPQGSDQPIGADPMTKAYAESLNLILEYLLSEIDIQEIVEAWVQDATSFNLGTLKATWRRDFLGDQLHDKSRPDAQDNIARLQRLIKDVATGRINERNDEWVELHQLREAILGDQEILLWAGLDISNKPFWAIRIDPRVRNIENIYNAAWISCDEMMTVSEVLERFPYEILEQSEDGTVTKWKGVHPMHIQEANRFYEDGFGVPCEYDAQQLTEHRKDHPNTEQDELVIVREVEHREQGRIITLIEGVPYPIRSWVPKNRPAQWYSYVFLCPNRLYGDVVGVSDVELQRDVVDRINRKASDEEKARANSIGRTFYPKNGLDPEDVKAINDSLPGQLVGINLHAEQTIADVVQTISIPYTPESYNRTEDYQMLRQLAAISEQTQGVTGRAKFAAEVAAAQQGTAIMASARQDRYRRALERAYRLFGELTILNLRPKEATEIGGQHVVWPQVVTEREAKILFAQVQNQAMQMAASQLMPQIEAAVMQGVAVDPAQVKAQLQEMVTTLVPQLMLEQTGYAEPLTREALYKRLRLKVTVSVNGTVDRQQRVQNAVSMMEIANASGTVYDGRPFIRLAAEELRLDDELGDAFGIDPNRLWQMALSAAQKNPESVSQETMRQVLGVADMMQAQLEAVDPQVKAGEASEAQREAEAMEDPRDEAAA